MTDRDTIHRAFTELAPCYEETLENEFVSFLGMGYDAIVDQLAQHLGVGNGDLVLDVATGTARLPLRLVDDLGDAGHVTGLDITPAMLGQSRQNVIDQGQADKISLVGGSGTSMPFGTGVFDAVVCGFGTHHMDVPQLLSEARRVLKNGGRLVLADAGAPESWRTRWGKPLLAVLLFLYRLTNSRARTKAESDAVRNIRTAQEWHGALQAAGLSDIRIIESDARKPWYPNALAITATVEGTSTQSMTKD